MPGPLAMAALAGIPAFLGGLLPDTQRQRSTSTTAPTFDPAFAGIKGRLLRLGMQRQNPMAMARSITSTRLQGINTASDAARTGLAARLASMGVRGDAAARPMGALDSRVFGEQVGALNDQPLLEGQLKQEELAQLMSILGLGRGTTTTTTGTTTGGGGVGGGLTDLGGMIGFLAGQGLLSGRPRPTA